MKPYFNQQLADLIHYPKCWDVAAYPTLEHAMFEVLLFNICWACDEPFVKHENN